MWCISEATGSLSMVCYIVILWLLTTREHGLTGAQTSQLSKYGEVCAAQLAVNLS